MARFEMDGTVLKAYRLDGNETCVTVPDGVTEIGKYAFSHSDFLVEVKLPESLVKIGEGAFASCKYLCAAHLPHGLREIGKEAFEWCISLPRIALPDTVSELGEGAFAMCPDLKEIEIPDGVTVIRERVFYGCISLRRIRFPAQTAVIEQDAFEDCRRLSEIELAAPPLPGSGLQNWLTAFVRKYPASAAGMYRNRTLTRETAEAALNAAQEQHDTELTALLLDFLHENGSSGDAEMKL